MSEKAQTVEAGFNPEALDPAIQGAIDRLTKAVADVERIRGGLEPTLDKLRTRAEKLLENPDVTDASIILQATTLVELLEKYARVALNLTKVVDESARLRSFVAGGSDSRPDLSSLSDVELRKLVKDGKSVA